MLPNHFYTVGKGRSLYEIKANITIGADKRIHLQEIQKPCSAFLLQLSLAKNTGVSLSTVRWLPAVIVIKE